MRQRTCTWGQHGKKSSFSGRWYAGKNISCINIAPGPINTDRTKELIENVEEFKKSLPMKRLGEPEEIGNFVKSIIENKIKYLSGVVINFDGANSNFIF